MLELFRLVAALAMIALSAWAIYVAVKVAQHVNAWPF